MTTPTRIVCSLLVLPLAIGACERQPAASESGTPAASSTPAPPAAPATSDTTSGATLQVAGLTLPVPDGWSQVPPSNSMRLAELSAPGEPEACEVAFSTAGGTVEANVGRWAMQMADASGGPLGAPVIDTREINGLAVHTVEMTGTYLGMRNTPPKPNTTLRGAIVETASGLVFIKMTGPADSMAATADGWNTMLDGLQAG